MKIIELDIGTDKAAKKISDVIKRINDLGRSISDIGNNGDTAIKAPFNSLLVGLNKSTISLKQLVNNLNKTETQLSLIEQEFRDINNEVKFVDNKIERLTKVSEEFANQLQKSSSQMNKLTENTTKFVTSQSKSLSLLKSETAERQKLARAAMQYSSEVSKSANFIARGANAISQLKTHTESLEKISKAYNELDSSQGKLKSSINAVGVSLSKAEDNAKKYEKALSKLNAYKDELSSQVKQIDPKGLGIEVPKEFKDNLNFINKEISNLTSEQKKNQKSIEDLTKKQSELIITDQNLTNTKERLAGSYSRINNELEEYRKKQDAIARQAKDLSNITNRQSANASRNVGIRTDDIIGKIGVNTERNKEIFKQANAFRDIGSAVKKSASDIGNLQSKYESLSKSIKDISKSNDGYVGKLTKIREALEQIKSLNNEVRVAEINSQSMEKARALLSDMQKQYSNNEDAIKSINKEINKQQREQERLSEKIRQSKSEYNRLNAELKEINKNTGLTSNKSLKSNMDELAKSISELEAKSKTYSTTIRSLEYTKSNLNRANTQLSVSQRQLTNEITSSANAAKNLAAETKELRSRINILQGTASAIMATEKATHHATSSVRLIGKQFRSLIYDMNAVRIAFVILSSSTGIGYFIKTIGDLDKSMARLKSLMANYSNMQLGADGLYTFSSQAASTKMQVNLLYEEIRRLGSITKYTAGEVGEAAIILAQAGLNSTETIQSLQTVLNMAVAGNLEMEKSAEIVVKGIKMFGMQVDEADKVADTYAATANFAATTVEKLAHAMTYAGSVAHTYGLSLAETNAFLGVLSNAGIDASVAGTSLRRIMVDLIKPTATATRYLEAYGINLKQMEKDGVPAVERLLNVIKAVGNDSAAIANIFRVTAFPAVASLNENMGELETLLGKLKDVEGYTKKIADINIDNLIDQFIQVKSAIEDTFIRFGEFTGLTRGLTEGLKNTANSIRIWNGDMAEAVGGVVRGIAVLAAIGLAMRKWTITVQENGVAIQKNIIGTTALRAKVATLTSQMKTSVGVTNLLSTAMSGLAVRLKTLAVSLATLTAATAAAYGIALLLTKAFEAIAGKSDMEEMLFKYSDLMGTLRENSEETKEALATLAAQISKMPDWMLNSNIKETKADLEKLEKSLLGTLKNAIKFNSLGKSIKIDQIDVVGRLRESGLNQTAKQSIAESIADGFIDNNEIAEIVAENTGNEGEILSFLGDIGISESDIAAITAESTNQDIASLLQNIIPEIEAGNIDVAANLIFNAPRDIQDKLKGLVDTDELDKELDLLKAVAERLKLLENEEDKRRKADNINNIDSNKNYPKLTEYKDLLGLLRTTDNEIALALSKATEGLQDFGANIPLDEFREFSKELQGFEGFTIFDSTARIFSFDENTVKRINELKNTIMFMSEITTQQKDRDAITALFGPPDKLISYVRNLEKANKLLITYSKFINERRAIQSTSDLNEKVFELDNLSNVRKTINVRDDSKGAFEEAFISQAGAENIGNLISQLKGVQIEIDRTAKTGERLKLSGKTIQEFFTVDNFKDLGLDLNIEEYKNLATVLEKLIPLVTLQKGRGRQKQIDDYELAYRRLRVTIADTTDGLKEYHENNLRTYEIEKRIKELREDLSSNKGVYDSKTLAAGEKLLRTLITQKAIIESMGKGEIKYEQDIDTSNYNKELGSAVGLTDLSHNIEQLYEIQSIKTAITELETRINKNNSSNIEADKEAVKNLEKMLARTNELYEAKMRVKQIDSERAVLEQTIALNDITSVGPAALQHEYNLKGQLLELEKQERQLQIDILEAENARLASLGVMDEQILKQYEINEGLKESLELQNQIASIDYAKNDPSDVLQGIGNAAEGMLRKVSNASEMANEAFTTFATAVKDALGTQLKSLLKTGEADWSQFFESIGDKMLDLAMSQIFNMIFGAIGGGIGGAIGGATSIGNTVGGVMTAASGAIIKRPTKFATNKGTTLAGEAGPEAIMPLKRLSNGKLGIYSDGDKLGSNSYISENAFSFNINMNGSSGDKQQDEEYAKNVSMMIKETVKSQIKEQLIEERRDGGMLTKNK